jgi:hypothetical protein
MGICCSLPVNTGPILDMQMDHDEGNAQLVLTQQGKYVVNLQLTDANAPQPRARLARMERDFFQACAEQPEFRSKPRENLKKHFCQYNETMDHGA